MSKIRIELDTQGVRQLLNDETVKQFISQEADAILSRLPSGYAKSEYQGRVRPNVSVFPETDEAKKDNLENNSVIKALL